MSNELITALQSAAGNAGSFYPYPVDNSVRFAGSETLYRAQTTPTNNKKWTFSCWFKYIGPSSSWKGIIGAGTSGSDYTNFYMNGNHWLLNHVSYGQMDNTAFYRDPSAWYHVVVAFDSTQASAGDRQKIWVNGVKEAQPYSYGSWPQNFNTNINKSGYTLYIGRSGESASYSTQYLAECVFIDGQQLDPTNFAETRNGVWVPKEITGLTFGNNGFYLDFADSSNFGNDVSGNNNDFTSSGLTSREHMPDTPTNNFSTLNPLDISNSTTLRYGNLDHAGGQLYTIWRSSAGTHAVSSGKWYAEVLCETTYQGHGIIKTSVQVDNGGENFLGGTAGWAMFINGDIYHDGSAYSYASTSYGLAASLGYY